MSRIQGITVVLHERTQDGTDPLGNLIYKTTDVNVNDVLVAPTSADDIVGSAQLEGTKNLYTLAIPKGDTNTWLENTVTFFGQTFHCYAEMVGIESNIPLIWNKKVLVERYDG